MEIPLLLFFYKMAELFQFPFNLGTILEFLPSATRLFINRRGTLRGIIRRPPPPPDLPIDHPLGLQYLFGDCKQFLEN